MASPIPAAEIAKHDSLDNLWLVVDGVVYDMSEFAPDHPGGVDILLRYAGRDATTAYNAVHSPSLIKRNLPPSKHLGAFDKASPRPAAWAQREQEEEQQAQSQQSSPSAGALTKGTKPPMDSLISAHDFYDAARASFTPKALAFITSAATDLHTYRRNSSAFADIGLRPRVLRDVRDARIATTMLGRPVRTPVFVAPTSLCRSVHPEGERELGRACALLGTAQVLSTSASFALDEVVAAMREEEARIEDQAKRAACPLAPMYFQLYVDRERAKSEKLLRDGVRGGLIQGVFVTVDAPVAGKREADERLSADLGITTPMSGMSAAGDKKGGALGRVMGKFIDPGFSWAELPWLRRCVGPDIPIVVKGVQTAADAVRAAKAGVQGIVVSNHGGRSLDTSPATILVLLELQRCCPGIFDQLEVFLDGGVMRGTDVFKALCLGAKAVGIGRGALYGLNYGKEGVQKFVEILNDELETTMRMVGINSLDEVHPGLLNTAAVDHLIPTTMSEEHPYAKWRPSKL